MNAAVSHRVSLPLLLALATTLLAADRKLELNTTPSTGAPIIELKGRLVPFTPGMRDVKIKTDAGAVHTLLSNRLSSALFIDTNLQSKTLLLKGRLWAGTSSFEVTGNFRSLRDGKVHELYYFCDICIIKGIDPGPCMCCRDPVRLVEELPGAEP